MIYLASHILVMSSVTYNSNEIMVRSCFGVPCTLFHGSMLHQWSGIAIVWRLSVCLSETLVDSDHTR